MALDTIGLPMTGRARDSLIAMSVLWLICTVVIGFRVRGRIRGPGLGLDDALAVTAYVLSTSTIGLNAAVFRAGVGHDFDQNAPDFPILVHNLPFIMQSTFAFTLVYIWCLAALKLSQLSLYLRVFNEQLRISVYIIGLLVILWAIVFNFVFIFLCDPISQQWTINRIGHCLDQILLLKCLIMTNLVTDLMIVVLPIRCVWRLQMRKTEKLAIISCFGLGLACVFIGIARFVLMYTIDLIGNLTGTSLTTFMLCTVELYLAGLCISIPMLRPFYLRVRAKYKSPSYGNSQNQSVPKVENEGRGRPVKGLHSQWFELYDKDTTLTTTAVHDDASSERKLTDDAADDAIHVSKQFAVTRN